MTASRLKSLQSRYGEAIDREIKSHLAARDDGHGFYTMMAYQFGYVDAQLQPVASAGGKRFRPVLCLLACESVRGSWETALPVAASVELLHNFSLIHDDIEDRDPERRHQPAVWKLWGEPKAINVGDGMFALASRVIMEARQEPATAVDLARGLHETALQLTEGQNMDMAFETQQEVTVDEYRAMIGRKTGALIAFSLWSGAIVGGAGFFGGRVDGLLRRLNQPLHQLPRIRDLAVRRPLCQRRSSHQEHT